MALPFLFFGNMSGYPLFILVEAKGKKEAVEAANAAIDNLWEANDLVEGDAGNVASAGQVHCLSKVGRAYLREFNATRKETAVHYLKRSQEELAKLPELRGYFVGKGLLSCLERVPLHEERDTDVGYLLRVWADIVEGGFTKHGIVWDPGTHQCGFSEERMDELMCTPKDWWLVECVVG